MIHSKKTPRPLIMGILNVTPDSFSDGGQYLKTDLAVQRAKEMLHQGADIIDIGGESTRPGAIPVATQEQINRVIPVIIAIRDDVSKDAIISVDTTDYQVASAALDSGANWINDISAGDDACDSEGAEERMLDLAAQKDATIVLMHRKGKSITMQNAPFYEDVVLEVKEYLQNRVSAALDCGVKKENIILDPGIGFGKLLDHNLSLLANIDTLVDLGYDVLLGTSRKRFIGEICDIEDADQRVAGTCATTALGVNEGVKIFRVHDVLENRQSADIAWKIRQACLTYRAAN